MPSPAQVAWADGSAPSRSGASVTPSSRAGSSFVAEGHETPLFSKKEPLKVTIAAPFVDLARKANAGKPDPAPPVTLPRSKEYARDGVKATASDGFEVNAAVRVRGHLTLTECTFPKLTVKLDDKDPDYGSSELSGNEKLKVGTHCRDPRGTTDELTPQGLLLGEKAPPREALALNLYSVIEPDFSLRARPARITYVDTGSAPATVMERDALVFEHPETAAKRLRLPRHERDVEGKLEKAPVLEETELFKLKGKEFSRQRTLRIALFQAMIGNWDFSVDARSIERTGGLRNTDVLVAAGADGSRELVPVPADFDRASMVSGKLRPPRPEQGTASPESDVVRQARAFLKENLKGYKAAEKTAAKQYFLDRKWDLLGAIRQAHVDEDGRELAFRHVSAFYEALHEFIPN